MILITGASGLVGGHLAWHLLQNNEHITAIKRTSTNLEAIRTIFSFYSNEPDRFLERIIWKNADVMEPESLQKAFEGIKIVYHCAAVVSLGNDRSKLTDTNVNGTRNIINTALEAGIEKLCFVSSIAACGNSVSNELISETTEMSELNNKSAYSQSKYLSELEVWKGIKSGLNAVIVNPGVILGVSGTVTGSAELFSRVKKGLPFYTNGGSGYVDVQDVAKIMIKLTESSLCNERYILVAENLSNKEVLTWIAEGYEKTKPFIGVGKIPLLIAGAIMEIWGKISGLKPLIDRSIAKTAISRSYYTSAKITNEFNYEFNSIRKCIADICNFEKK